jgi:hypothetical protein
MKIKLFMNGISLEGIETLTCPLTSYIQNINTRWKPEHYRSIRLQITLAWLRLTGKASEADKPDKIN